jgi:HD-GYP domain-containing protein (c-di-GMP phosphodiesterase class II)
LWQRGKFLVELTYILEYIRGVFANMRHRIRLNGVSREIEGRAWEAFDLVRIGREQQSDVQLDNTSISRCHAELAFVEPLGWFVRDLSSTNGTFLNGVRVGAQERKIRERDLVQVGNLVLRVVSIDQVERSALESRCGTIQIEASTKHSFDEAFEVAAHGMAQHTGTASQLMGLLRAGHDLHQISSIDELLRKSLDDAARILHARRGALVLVDESTGALTLQAATPDPSQTPAKYRFSKTLAQRSLARGESLLSRDVREDADSRGSDAVAHGNMGSVLCALLRSPQKRLGILHLDRLPQDKPFNLVDLHLANAIAASIAGSIESAHYLLAKQRSWFIQTVITLAQTIELRDPCTAGHAQRVTKYALLLAEALKLPSKALQQIETGSRLHDIGKIGIRDSVLRKKGRLSDLEFEHMKSHTVKGAAILASIPDLAPMLPIVRNHHERWDGRGYPDKLAGDRIPLAARIVAVADSFDAMTSDRPYRPGMSIDEAFEQLQRGAGTQFDPQCSRAFAELKSHLVKMVPTKRSAQPVISKPAQEKVPTGVDTECVLV